MSKWKYTIIIEADDAIKQVLGKAHEIYEEARAEFADNPNVKVHFSTFERGSGIPQTMEEWDEALKNSILSPETEAHVRGLLKKILSEE